MRCLISTTLACMLFAIGAASAQSGDVAVLGTKPPIAKKVPHVLEAHGDKRTDEYYWMRDREDPEVIEYLNQENDYMRSMLAPTDALQEKVFEETKARIKQDDSTVPYEDRGFIYYSRTAAGSQYRIYCRKKGSQDAAEQVILDVNQLAEGKSFCSVGGVAVSSESNLLAYGVDFVGRRIYTVQFKNLDTGELLDDKVENVTSNLVWAEDNKTLFYARQDPTTLRYFQIYRHKVGTPADTDVLVYEEKDEEFSCYVGLSRSRKYLLISCDQTLSSECHYLDAQHPNGEFQVVLPREADHEYSVDHIGDSFYIRTNWEAQNFRLMRTAVGNTDKSKWEEVVPHREDTLAQFV